MVLVLVQAVPATEVVTVETGIVIAVIGILTPWITTLATKLHASGWVKTLVSTVVGGLAATAAALAGIPGTTSVGSIIIIFVVGLASAAGLRLQGYVGTIESWLAKMFPNLGFRAPKDPKVIDYKAARHPPETQAA